MNQYEIYIIHRDWKGYCTLQHNVLYRNDHIEEYGIYYIDKNKLYIQWEKWKAEFFYAGFDQTIFYVSDLFFNIYRHYYLLKKKKNSSYDM